MATNKKTQKSSKLIQTVSRIHANVLTEGPPEDYDVQTTSSVEDDIENYSLLKFIGRGKYSHVFLASKDDEQKVVVVKVLKKISEIRTLKEMKILENLREGVNITKLLSTVYDIGSDRVSLIFEYLGTEITFRQVYLTLTPDEVRDYTFQIIQALDYCHSKGIMHRDIKPENIIIATESKKLMLVDFGLADFYFPRTNYSTDVATFSYKAPELILNYPYYDYSIDMWSLGCTFAAMVFKKHPFFNADTQFNLLGNIAKILGSAKLYYYVNKYNITTSKYFKKGVGRHVRKEWRSLNDPLSQNDFDDKAYAFLNSILKYDHVKRLTAREAIGHPYFRTPRSRGNSGRLVRRWMT